MTDLLITTLVATFALGLATWHLARVVSDGALFRSLRVWLRTYLPVVALDCRLCLNMQVAIYFTWFALLTGLAAQHDALPLVGWVFAFAVGPFLTAGWAEVIRRVECCEVKG